VCGPELSDIESTFWNNVDTSQVQVFGISDGESFATAVNFASNFGLTYPVLHDPNGIVYNSYNMSGLSPYPRDVIIDQNGIIQYMHSEYDPQYMLQVVNNLLNVNEVENRTEVNLPNDFNLEVYPNPFNPTTNIIFNIIDSKQVELKIFNVVGQRVISQIYNKYHAGAKESIQLNMSDFSSGVYYLQISNGKHFSTKKLVLLR